MKKTETVSENLKECIQDTLKWGQMMYPLKRHAENNKDEDNSLKNICNII